MMVYKISLYFLLPMLFIALFLSLAGVRQVEFGNTYYYFLNDVGNSFNSWKLEIPPIPKIPTIAESSYDSSGLILAVLIKIANVFLSIINGFVGLLNIIVSVGNVIIQLIQFILTVIYCCKDFIEGLIGSVIIAYV